MEIPKEKFSVECFLKKVWCVYFLYHEDELVYIGKTGDLENRIRNHLKEKKFNTFTFIKTESEEDAYFLEKKMIKKYLPKLNYTFSKLKPVNSIVRNYEGRKFMEKVLKELCIEFHKNNSTGTIFANADDLKNNLETIKEKCYIESKQKQTIIIKKK